MAFTRAEDGLVFFEFVLREDMEVCVDAYSLRNGSRSVHGCMIMHASSHLHTNFTDVATALESGCMSAA
jgi:hypothetical protein